MIEPMLRPALSDPPEQPIEGMGSLESTVIMGSLVPAAPAAAGCAPLPAAGAPAAEAPACAVVVLIIAALIPAAPAGVVVVVAV
jgi:hypothetical protein